MLRGPPETENERSDVDVFSIPSIENDHNLSSDHETEVKKTINYVDPNVTVIAKTKQTCKYNTKEKHDVSKSKSHKDKGQNKGQSQAPLIDHGPYCLPTCKYKGNEAKQPMVRCCLCMNYFHDHCINDTSEEINASKIWTCNVCRKMPSLIMDELKAIRQTNADLVKLLAARTGECEALRAEVSRDNRHTLENNCKPNCMCDDLRKQNHILIETNANLVQQLSKLAEDKCSPTHKESTNVKNPNHQKAAQAKSLLIGSSIIRDIYRQALPDYDVICSRGATIIDLHKELSKITAKYKNILIVVGGNDCSSIEDTDGIITNFKSLISLSKDLVEDRVIVSSICPRLHSATVQGRIESVNAALMLDAESDNYTFVNNDLTYRLQDNTINDGYYLPDGVHLSQAGTKKLAKNLNLSPVAGKDIVWIKRASPRSNRPSTTDQSRINHRRNNYKENDSTPIYEYRQNRSHAGTRFNHQANNNFQGTSQNNNVPTPIGIYHDNFKNYHINSNGAQTQTNPVYCWNCGETGHVTQSCRFGQPVKCLSCSRFGHKYKFCHLYD